jgi:hypothetical protein
MVQIFGIHPVPFRIIIRFRLIGRGPPEMPMVTELFKAKLPLASCGVKSIIRGLNLFARAVRSFYPPCLRTTPRMTALKERV